MPEPQQLERIKQLLFQPPDDWCPVNTYVILDTARDEVIYPKIMETDIPKKCMFHGEKAVELATVAPYLVLLKKDDPFTDWLLNQGWGKSWGIFCQSSENLDKLQRHFRTFLMVYDEDGKPLYFRFYDPRVFRVYLPTCNAKELEIVYGSVKKYYTEGEEETLFEFSCTGGFKLFQDKVSL